MRPAELLAQAWRPTMMVVLTKRARIEEGENALIGVRAAL
jgi:hypothetical protein